VAFDGGFDDGDVVYEREKRYYEVMGGVEVGLGSYVEGDGGGVWEFGCEVEAMGRVRDADGGEWRGKHVGGEGEVPSVMWLLGLRDRYSRQGGATMLLPRTRIFFEVSEAFTKVQMGASKCERMRET
jgi:hypothetical protein